MGTEKTAFGSECLGYLHQDCSLRNSVITKTSFQHLNSVVNLKVRCFSKRDYSKKYKASVVLF